MPASVRAARMCSAAPQDVKRSKTNGGREMKRGGRRHSVSLEPRPLGRAGLRLAADLPTLWRSAAFRTPMFQTPRSEHYDLEQRYMRWWIIFPLAVVLVCASTVMSLAVLA